MTINLFVIANVKQLRTDGSFRTLLPFFRTSWGVGVLNSAIFNSFHIRVKFGTILEGLRNFGRGGFNPQTTLPVRHCTLLYRLFHLGTFPKYIIFKAFSAARSKATIHVPLSHKAPCCWRAKTFFPTASELTLLTGWLPSDRSANRYVDKICPLMGYHAAYSGNSILTFPDYLTVLSSRVKNQFFDP